MNTATMMKQHVPPKSPSTFSAFFTGNQIMLNNYVYCEGEHYSSSCQVVKYLKERRAILMRGGRCFVYLKPQHHAKDCENCRRCHKQHHQSLCDTLVNKPLTVDTKEPPVDKTTAANTTNSIKDKKAILLQTARAVASDSDGTKEVNICILFGNGSQRSYITEAIRSKLGLRSIKREKPHLNSFRDNKYQTKTCDTT